MNKKLVSVAMAMAMAVAAVAVTAGWAGCGGSETKGTGGATATSTSTTSSTTGSSVGGSGGFGGFGGTAPAIQCNPVTNSGCTAQVALGGAGGSETGACDLATDPVSGAPIGFVCYTPPNDAMLCQTCDAMSGPFCAGGTTCVATGATNQCARFCCTDADCGSGTCDTTNSVGMMFSTLAPGLGICVAGASAPDGGAGDAGVGGAGVGGAGVGGAGAGGAGVGMLACDVPATPPSMGSCVTLSM